MPVVQANGVVCGVLSHRDVLERMAMVADAQSLGHTSARQLVSHAMRVPAVTISPDDPVGAAARVMADRKLGCLPVVEDGALVGIVTTIDLLAELGMSEAIREVTASPRVADVMTRDPATATRDEPLARAIERMLELGVRHLPVVDANLHVVGIVSDRDVRTAIGDPCFHGDDPRSETRDVGQIMTLSPFLLHPEEPITKAVGRLVDERVGALPVVDAKSRLVGIVSYLDVLRFLRGSRIWGEART